MFSVGDLSSSSISVIENSAIEENPSIIFRLAHQTAFFVLLKTLYLF